MLKTRILTALVLAAILIGSTFFAPHWCFSLIASAFFIIGAWEWSRLSGYQGTGRFLVTLMLAGLLIAAGLWIGFSLAARPAMHGDRLLWLAGAACGWWLAAVVLVKAYPAATRFWAPRWVQTLMGVLVIVPAWAGLAFLNATENGAWLIMILIVSVVCADTGAYFVGRRFGKTKLAPNVSPGKSMEGFFGGLVCSTLFGLCLVWFADVSPGGGWLLATVVLASLASVFGDLLESMLKRNRGIKDSGRVLPGHGGVLDRLDSITAATPVFTFIYLLSGWQL